MLLLTKIKSILPERALRPVTLYLVLTLNNPCMMLPVVPAINGGKRDSSIIQKTRLMMALFFFLVPIFYPFCADRKKIMAIQSNCIRRH